MTTATTPQTQQSGAQGATDTNANGAPSAPNGQPAQTQATAPDTTDWKARAEAAAEAARKTGEALEKLTAEHQGLKRSIEDGTLVNEILAKALGRKPEEDPAKALEKVRGELSGAQAQSAQAQATIKRLAVQSALTSLVGSGVGRAHNPGRLASFIRVDDLKVDAEGSIANVDDLKKRVDELRKTDPYLFESSQTPAATAGKDDSARGAPLPPAATPPAPANPGTPPASEKPRRRWGIGSVLNPGG